MKRSSNKRITEFEESPKMLDVEFMRQYIINLASSNDNENLIKMLYVRAKNLEKIV